MRKPQIITSPSGEELVMLPHSDYEDLVDARRQARSIRRWRPGVKSCSASRKPLPCSAAPVPLAFWRKQRGKTQSQLAADICVSQNFLSDLERGEAGGGVALYAKLARCLGVQIEDLVSDDEAQTRAAR
jgi:DNA-binding XRE family transcriptional regulator